MQVKKVEFQYKGERDYIQGPDIFNLMMEDSEPYSTVKNIIFTVHDFISTTMCNFYSTEDESLLLDIENISAKCKLEINGTTKWMGISPDDRNNSTGKNLPYDESQVIALCNMMDDSIILNYLSPYSFIETIVAMNKHMHQQLFPEVTGKWIFTRIDLPYFCDAKENIALRLRHNMNYKLTKCDIEVGGNKVGDIFFSMVHR